MTYPAWILALFTLFTALPSSQAIAASTLDLEDLSPSHIDLEGSSLQETLEHARRLHAFPPYWEVMGPSWEPHHTLLRFYEKYLDQAEYSSFEDFLSAYKRKFKQEFLCLIFHGFMLIQKRRDLARAIERLVQINSQSTLFQGLVSYCRDLQEHVVEETDVHAAMTLSLIEYQRAAGAFWRFIP